MKSLVVGAVITVLGSCHGSSSSDVCAPSPWTQFGHDAEHSNAVCVAAQPINRQLAHITYDPFAAAEQIDGGGDLHVHYQAPLVVGGDVYMMFKGGTYTPCTPAMPPAQPSPVCANYHWNTQVWSEKRLSLQGGMLVEQWSFDSDWKPEPTPTFEPVFQPVLTGDTLWVPGAGGSVYMLDRTSGKVRSHVQPFGATIDPDTYVAGGIAADTAGNVYYDALKLNHMTPGLSDAQGWLVVVAPNGTFRTASFEQLVPGAPAATAMCERDYSTITPTPPAKPWPPKDPTTGVFLATPSGPCGSQRPSINVTPAIGADGTIYTVAKAHLAQRYVSLIAVTPDLQPKWQRSFRGLLNDGCGVLVPDDGSATEPSHCTPGAPMGVDPATNAAPAGTASDSDTSSPAVLPDGTLLYGSNSSYNMNRGHLFKFDANGAPLGSYDFGLDITPGIWRHDGTYSIVIKDNHYGTDQYGVDLGPYYMTQLDADLKVEWQFKSTNTQSCVPTSSGKLMCTSDHPNGFEWCINAPVVDKDGTVLATGEDGNAYVIAQGGHEQSHLFLNVSANSAYTPLTLDETGLVYAMNFGTLSVLGR